MIYLYEFGHFLDVTLPAVIDNRIRFYNDDLTQHLGVQLEENAVLVCVEQLSISKHNFGNDKTHWSNRPIIAEDEILDVATEIDRRDPTWVKARKRLKLTGRLPGWVVVIGDRTAWISQFDLSRLKRID